MSENQENKKEKSVEKEWKEIKAREKTIVLKNNVTADQIPIHVSEQDATKLKELFEQQNQAHNQLEKENAELRKERSSEIEDQIGKTETTAPLNENQVTGKTNEDIIRENREIQ